MPMTTRSLLLLFAGVLPACGSTPLAPTSPASMDLAASAPSETTPTASPSVGVAAVAPPAAAGKWTELEVSPGAAELEQGAGAVAASDWTKARSSLGPAIEKLRTNATLDVVFAGEALLGRACAAVKDTACAKKNYAAIIDAWNGAETVRAITDAAGPDDSAKKEHLERALLAVSEARFFAGEQKRAECDRLVMPEYKGDGSKDSVSDFISGKVAEWVKKKVHAIHEAENEYGAIAALEPTAPPRWAIAASSRVGTLWGKFTAEFRAAPIPSAWRGSGPVYGVGDLTWDDVRTSYYAALDAVSEPQKLIARAAFEKCSGEAAKLGYADSFSKTCDSWLAKNYPSR